MKHHEYTIYYGGFKKKLKGYIYCDICGLQTRYQHDHTQKNVRSHKKPTGKPR